MSSFDNSRILPNLIPTDEDGNPVSVQYWYDTATKKYFPSNFESGTMLTSIVPRPLSYEIMHNEITVATPVKPASPLGLFDLTGYGDIIMDIKLEGSGSSVTLVPLYWNPITQIYHTGGSQKFTDSDRFYCDVNGCPDFYLLPVQVAGTVTVVISGA